MKTRISAFCDAYENLLTPLDDLVERVVGRIEEEGRQDLLELPQTRLSDARHRFHSLREKIEHQQAYLIIFGPLKSGKSTLMNAISGTYVSEVTAMPAYPCLVYVADGEETAFSAIKYNGISQEFADSESLAEVLEEGHSHLASRIRMHELEGEEFDPRVHYTEAVRRIDVRTPVPQLREASTVLVDTPGLYSRMKFGYDLMTREFRDSAACAVFVVKSDNLFLDQVFEEFTELLEQFSRIFLVVNIDAGKRDLQPDGSLAPSLESSDPEQIVEAFKSLAMTAPLQEAYEAGRLQIYPVDLLNAAAGSLGGAEDRDADPPFDAFLSDLTEYLNSSDYLLEFERDSLRQGATICAEVHDACDLSSNEAFQREQSELQRAAEELPALMSVIDELSGSDMASTFERSRSACLDSANHLAKRARKDLRKQMGAALNGWMENDESLQALLDRWNKSIAKACDPIMAGLPQALASKFDTPTGGAEFDAALVGQLQELRLDLEPIVRPAVAKLNALPDPEVGPVQLRADQISVNRSFLDRILFRSVAKIRQRLFGPADAPDKPITAPKKRKWLAEQGFVELHEVIDRFLERSFPALQCGYVEEHADAFIGQISAAFAEQLASIRSKIASHLESTNERIAADGRIFEVVGQLDEKIAAVEERIGAMQDRHLPVSEEEVEAEAEAELLEDNGGVGSEPELPEGDGEAESELVGADVMEGSGEFVDEEDLPVTVVAKQGEAESAGA